VVVERILQLVASRDFGALSATEDELAEVAGIGVPIAEKIRNIVKETGVPYGSPESQ